ncbi:hypothetical protein ACFC09_19400 [Streptomyces sp. NPDC056161]|uniref:hypothetical protein n=1 Tax=Streptomyces sp. NPDC056161 TaxID=3345732 RepID=UPI0035D5703F
MSGNQPTGAEKLTERQRALLKDDQLRDVWNVAVEVGITYQKRYGTNIVKDHADQRKERLGGDWNEHHKSVLEVYEEGVTFGRLSRISGDPMLKARLDNLPRIDSASSISTWRAEIPEGADPALPPDPRSDVQPANHEISRYANAGLPPTDGRRSAPSPLDAHSSRMGIKVKNIRNWLSRGGR